MNTEFVVEFQCPQCGAPASLKESSRLFICEYCNVKSYLVPRHGFQYVLPSQAPEHKEVIYFPYWRFRGVLFICGLRYIHGEIASEVIDKTLQATPSEFFPFNLGYKVQLLKIKFTGPDTRGRIFTPTIPLNEAVEHLKTHCPTGYHSEFIGSLDLIYAPFYIHDNTVYGAVYNKRVDHFWDKKIKMTKDVMAKLPPVGSLKQDVEFIPTLCPHCGWDTECARDSYLLACKNCDSFWKPRREGLKRLGLARLPGDPDTALYLPFWRVRPEITGIQLDSYADLIRVANLIKDMKEDYSQTRFYFWIPAFKISSHRFLQIAKRVTISQPQGKLEQSMPKDRAYPVTLPMPEAIKSLKTVFADFVSFPEINYPKLGGIVIRPKRLSLIYLPFQAIGSEIIHPKYKVRVSKKTLEHFRQF